MEPLWSTRTERALTNPGSWGHPEICRKTLGYTKKVEPDDRGDQQKVDDCYEVHNLIFMIFVLFFAYLQMVCEAFINRPVMCVQGFRSHVLYPDINPGHL